MTRFATTVGSQPREDIPPRSTVSPSRRVSLLVRSERFPERTIARISFRAVLAKCGVRCEVGGNNVDFPGGGLPISSPFSTSRVYGETYTPRLVGALILKGATIVGRQFMVTTYAATRTAIAQNLTMGDVLAFASSSDLRSDGTGVYEHICLLLSSDGKIACHTISRFGKDYTDVYFPWVTLLKLPS